MRFRFPKFRLFRRRYFFKKSKQIITFPDDDSEVIRVYTKATGNTHVSETLSMESDMIYSCDTKTLARRYPVSIPPLTAHAHLQHAILSINSAKEMKLLQVTDVNNDVRRYKTKSGIWGGENARVIFAQNGSGKIQRLKITTNRYGFPCICTSEKQSGFEVRLVEVKDMPREGDVLRSAAHQDGAVIEGISHAGELPQWAKEIQRIAKKHRFWEQFENKSKRRMSLLDLAEKYHAAACEILALDKTKKSLKRKEIEQAYRTRMNVIHPDKVSVYNLNTDDIAQALLWAKNFLCPL